MTSLEYIVCVVEKEEGDVDDNGSCVDNDSCRRYCSDDCDDTDSNEIAKIIMMVVAVMTTKMIVTFVSKIMVVIMLIQTVMMILMITVNVLVVMNMMSNDNDGNGYDDGICDNCNDDHYRDEDGGFTMTTMLLIMVIIMMTLLVTRVKTTVLKMCLKCYLISTAIASRLFLLVAWISAVLPMSSAASMEALLFSNTLPK